MTIYSAERDMAPSIKKAVNHALRESLTSPKDGLVPLMLDGTPKVLVIEWNGNLARPFDDTFDPGRGDGRVSLLRPWNPGYQIPPQFLSYYKRNVPKSWAGETTVPWNIRASVPLWLLGPRLSDCSQRVLLGCGAYHPRWSAMMIDLYCPQQARKLIRMYFAHVDSDLDHPAPDDVPLIHQWQSVKDAGGELWRGPEECPAFDSSMLA